MIEYLYISIHKTLHVHTAGGDRDAPWTYILLAVKRENPAQTIESERDAPCMCLLLEVKVMHYARTNCWRWKGNILHAHTFSIGHKVSSRELNRHRGRHNKNNFTSAAHDLSNGVTKVRHEPGSSRSLAYCSTIVPHFHAYCKYQKQNCILNTLKYFSP